MDVKTDNTAAEASEPLSPIQFLPRNVFREKSEENCGGYDCEFVEPPQSTFQTECPVCLQILKEPCLISCCGHKFCRECIERIMKTKKPCALCNEPDFTFLRERGLERSLKDLEVWCSYRKEGCEWKGKLEKLEQHLNRDPSPENQLNGCQFVAVDCTHKCGEWFQRRHITTHETQQCKKRPYSCDHCRDYHSTFENVIEIHYPQCGKYPVACPNDCDVYMIERQNLQGHLKEQCPLALVDCPFHFAGCEIRLPREDMPEHMEQSVIHLTLLATATQNLLAENQQLLKENQELRHKQQITENEVGALKEEVQKQKLEVQHLVNHPGFPVDCYVKQPKEVVYLPAFYTHPHGYRMCISVHPNGGKGTHISIYAHIMRGPFDRYLKWPFRGEIAIQLVNQAGNHDHIQKIFPYTDETTDAIAGRVATSNERARGRGYQQFLAHDELQYNAERKTQYLKDDTLHIRVMKVTLTY